MIMASDNQLMICIHFIFLFYLLIMHKCSTV